MRPMEGLRGFAVFLVFLVHYATLVSPWIAQPSALFNVATALHTIGNAGVDLFFVLSGYLIYGSLMARPQPFLRFMTRRIQRIYPAFIVVFVLYLAMSFVFRQQSKIPSGTAAATAYILQNLLLLPGIFPIEPIITVAWSLSYEMFYYLAIPVLIGAFSLRQRSSRWRVTCFSLLAAAIPGYSALFGGHVRLIMFIAGILLYEAMATGTPSAPSSAVSVLALVLGLLATLLPIAGPAGFTLKMCILFVAFSALCYTCFRRTDDWLPRLASWTPLRWLGNMSYSYYLLHGLALKAGFMMLAKLLPVASHGVLFFILMLVVMFAFTLIPTALLFITVERPYSFTPKPSRTAPAGLAQAR